MTNASGSRHSAIRILPPWWVLTPLVLVAILAAGFAGFFYGQSAATNDAKAVPVLGHAPRYTMTNQFGKTVSSASFHGKVQLVNFLFPYCTTLCPLIAAHLVNLENLDLVPDGLSSRVEIVSFNIDPAGTGPKEMRAFLRQYGWNPKNPRWQYLTGSPDEIRRVVSKGFGVWYQRVKNRDSSAMPGGVVQPEVANPLAKKANVDYDIAHDDVLEIIGPKGRIREIYQNADTLGSQQLVSMIRRVLAG